MKNMTEQPSGVGFMAQMREKLKAEPTTLIPVHERNFPVFKKTLSELSDASAQEAFLPVTGNSNETVEEWVHGAKALWVTGGKTEGLLKPEAVTGFANVYAPEHTDKINEWLKNHPKLSFDAGSMVEAAAFVKDIPDRDAHEMSVYKQMLGKVFISEPAFRDTKAVTIWVTHEPDNTLSPQETDSMKKLGAWALGSTRYSPSESVDSTCFVVTKHSYLDALAGKVSK